MYIVLVPLFPLIMKSSLITITFQLQPIKETKLKIFIEKLFSPNSSPSVAKYDKSFAQFLDKNQGIQFGM